MTTVLETLKKHWMTSPGYAYDKTKDFEEFVLSKEAQFLVNAIKDYARQACEAQRELCATQNPELITQSPEPTLL